MDGKQLELPFDTQIQAALMAPEMSSVKSLWTSVEQQISGLSDEKQLQTGAQAIAQLARVVEAKAAHLFDEWERRYTPRSEKEPVLDADLLSGVLRQSMQLNLDDALQPYTPRRPQPSQGRESVQSVVQEMDKTDLLDLIEEDRLAYEQAIATAHDEDVSAWIEAIAQYLCLGLKDTVDRIRLVDLQHCLHRPLIEIWLGLLLGNIGHLQQIGDDFYALDKVYVTGWNSSDRPLQT